MVIVLIISVFFFCEYSKYWFEVLKIYLFSLNSLSFYLCKFVNLSVLVVNLSFYIRKGYAKIIILT